MNRFLMSAAVVALALTTTAEAAPHNKGAAQPHRSSQGAGFPRKPTSTGKVPYNLSKGTKFQKGYFYKGKNHNHWSCKVFWKKYGCWCWWCPNTHCWYYWCDAEDCYYPINYVVISPVVAETPAETGLVPLIEGSEMPTVGPDGQPLQR